MPKSIESIYQDAYASTPSGFSILFINLMPQFTLLYCMFSFLGKEEFILLPYSFDAWEFLLRMLLGLLLKMTRDATAYLVPVTHLSFILKTPWLPFTSQFFNKWQKLYHVLPWDLLEGWVVTLGWNRTDGEVIVQIEHSHRFLGYFVITSTHPTKISAKLFSSWQKLQQ